MKTMVVLALVCLSGPVGARGAASAHHPHHAGHAALTTRAADAVVKVNGLVCDFCIQALTKTFKKRSEVRDFRINLAAKELRMAFAPGRSLDDATIRTLVTNAGYDVVAISRKAS